MACQDDRLLMDAQYAVSLVTVKLIVSSATNAVCGLTMHA